MPKKHVTRRDELRELFTLSSAQMHELIQVFQKEMALGLEGDESTIRMLPTYVTEMPSGTEKGAFFALDLGG